MRGTRDRGMALLVAVIFATVMLSFGVLISSLGYKQTLLTQSARESQSALYAADVALECALYADQVQERFADETGAAIPSSAEVRLWCGSEQVTLPATGGSYVMRAARFSLDAGTRCADVTVYKPLDGIGKTRIYAQGYSAGCAVVNAPSGARFSSRGLKAQY